MIGDSQGHRIGPQRVRSRRTQAERDRIAIGVRRPVVYFRGGNSSMTAAVCRPGYVLADRNRRPVVGGISHSVPVGISLIRVRRSRAVVDVIWYPVAIQIRRTGVTQVARNREVKVSATIKCASRGDDISIGLKCGGECL